VRYPNLYASIAATVNFVVRSPRQFGENLARLHGMDVDTLRRRFAHT
jgi:hypothetical protein